MKFLFSIIAVLFFSLQSAQAATITPAFGKWSSASGSVDAGKQNINTMQVQGASFSKPGNKPTMRVDVDELLPYPSDSLACAHAQKVGYSRPEWWGGKADDPDVTTALAAAANCRVNTINGYMSKILLAMGTYVSGPITTLAGLFEVDGESEFGSGIKLKDGSNDTLFKVDKDTVANFSNLFLVGNQANQTGTSYGIWYKPNTSYTIAGKLVNVRVSDFKSHNVFVDDYRNQLYVLSGSKISGSGADGIHTTTLSTDIFIDDAEVGANNGYNGYFGGGAQISNSTWYQAGSSAIYFGTNTNYASVVSCQIDKNQNYGILIDGPAGQKAAVNIAGNRFNDNGQAANNTYSNIYAKNATGANILGNTFLNQQGGGNGNGMKFIVDVDGPSTPYINFRPELNSINNINYYCTSAGTPSVCCTGSKTGTCGGSYGTDIISDWSVINLDVITAASVMGKLGVGTIAPEGKLHVYENANLGATGGNSQLLSTVQGVTGTNQMFSRIWGYRKSNGTDWTTWALHDGIGIDTSFSTPRADKTWYERFPQGGRHSWGNEALETFSISSLGLLKQTLGSNVSSSSTIAPTGSLVRVSGTSAISLMDIPYAGWSGQVTLIPTGVFTLATGGAQSGLHFPFAAASTAVLNKPITCTFDGNTWYPSY